MNRSKLVIAATTIVLVLASLSIGLATVVRAQNRNASQPVDLDGTSWILTHIGDASLPSDLIGTLAFSDGKAAGSATCNRYSGSYEQDGADLSFGPLMTTMMACLDSTVETAFLAAMERVASFQIVDDQLLLVDGSGNTVLTFKPQPTLLAGTSWQLRSYHKGSAMVSVIAGSEITASFDGDRLSGSAGCNSYFAAFETDGTQLTLGPAGSTEMYCAQPEGVMEQEAAYVDALQSVASYQIEGNKLTLLDEEGMRLALFVLGSE